MHAIANPATARVIFLGLNPGHSEHGAQDYARADFRAALFNNLSQTPQPCPLYPLNPAFVTAPSLNDSFTMTNLTVASLAEHEHFTYESSQQAPWF